jgi:acetate---CoA ligase (ADP-forming)
LSAVGTEATVDLRRLMHPSSIAVVGATDRPGSYAAQVLLNIETIGFEGEVWGVNPSRDEVLGHPCVPSIAELPVAADALVVAIPAAGVPEVIDQAGARGCGGAVVISAGFGEIAEGVALNEQLLAASARHGLPICGPNCNGIAAPATRTALWGDALAPSDAGPVALVSQSGNVAVNALASRRGLRFHTVIASGNQVILHAADYLEFLADEDGIGAIAMYLEDDGGPRFCDGLVACAEANVPVVVLKVGESRAGARAAAAHSAALAGDQRVFRSLVKEAGAVWADDVHELLELAKTIAVPRPRPAAPDTSRGVAIMTCSGGDSAQGADESERIGLELPELSATTRGLLRELLPPAATVANPLDYTAMIWGNREALAALVRTLGEDPSIGRVVVFYDQPAGLTGAAEESWRAVREGIIAGAAVSPVPTLVSSTLPELLDDQDAWEFARAGVAAAAGLRTGLRCALEGSPEIGDPARLREIAALARSMDRRADGQWLAEHEAKAMLSANGIAVPEGRVVVDEDDAVAALDELGSSVALKVSSRSVQHKSDLGGVALGLRSPDEARDAYRRLAALAAVHDGSVLAERMAPPGVELMIAVRTDGIVPALVLALGGIWTELLDDVAIVPLPAGAARIESALRSLRGAPLLLGGRGGESVDLPAVARLAEGLGALLLERSLAEIECNPVFAGAPGDGAVAVDATIRLTGEVG